jgi:pimeloyl-ACP methyl ester carboxylesterase
MDPAEAAKEAFSYDWSSHEKSVEIDGRRVNYIELGEVGKPVLLFIHGIMGTWGNWIFNLRPFADRFHVIAIDMPGFGASEMPKKALDMTLYADVTKKFCDELGLRKVTLVGNSMGGLIGAIVAKTTPEILDRLVIVDGAGFSTASGWLARVEKAAHVLDPILRLVYKYRELINKSRFIVGPMISWAVAGPLRIAPEVSLMLLTGAGRPAFRPAANSILRTRIDKVTGVIALPTLIVWGRKDVLIPKRDAFRFMRICNDSAVKIIDGAGHLPMLEKPEAFNALIEEFAAQVVPEPETVAAA